MKAEPPGGKPLAQPAGPLNIGSAPNADYNRIYLQNLVRLAP